MNTNQRGNVAMGLLMGFAALYVVTMLTGCGGSTGWRVSFGVAPVKQVDDRQELMQVNKPLKKQHANAY